MSSGQAKLAWQRKQRAAFRERNGYSTASEYGAGGLRKAVLERDGYRCVVCGMTDAQHKEEWGRPITVDHKDKDRGNNTMENLQTLCLRCHGRKDLIPRLREQQVVKFKDEILRRRTDGQGYEQIATDLGFSIASIWKWYKRWTGGSGVRDCRRIRRGVSGGQP